MSCDEDAAMIAENTGVQGDVWGQSWSKAATDTTYDVASLLVQIRATTAGTLVASSGAQGADLGVIQIDTTGTDFSVDPLTLVWETTDDTANVDPDGVFILEMECDVNGVLKTFYSHDWIVQRQYAEAT